MIETKDTFTKLSVKSNVKREIDILAASEKRDVYVVVDDMLQLYKAVVLGKAPRPKEIVSIADVVANHEMKKAGVKS